MAISGRVRNTAAQQFAAGCAHRPVASQRRRDGNRSEPDGMATAACQLARSRACCGTLPGRASRWFTCLGSRFRGRFTVWAIWPPSAAGAMASSWPRSETWPRYSKRLSAVRRISGSRRWTIAREGRLRRRSSLLRTRTKHSSERRSGFAGRSNCRSACALLAKCPRIDLREVYGTPAAISGMSQLARQASAGRAECRGHQPGIGRAIGQRKTGRRGRGRRRGRRRRWVSACWPRISGTAARISCGWRSSGGDTPVRAHRRRTAMVLELHNRPGALADVLTVFNREKLDLTRIESLPAAGMDRPCVLFLEVGGSQSGAAFRRAIAAVTKKTLRLDVLGLRIDH